MSSTGVNSHAPTNLDKQNAMIYARMKINRLKCLYDSNIVNKFCNIGNEENKNIVENFTSPHDCKNDNQPKYCNREGTRGNPGLAFISQGVKTTQDGVNILPIPCPKFIQEYITALKGDSVDSRLGIACKPKAGDPLPCVYGKCRITNESSCSANSFYNPSPKPLPQKYAPPIGCKKDEDCSDVSWAVEAGGARCAEFNPTKNQPYSKKCVPKNQYLEWNVTPTGSCTDPITENDMQDGKCILGNNFLRQWCEEPSSRTIGTSIPGITSPEDTFNYNKNTGQCTIPPEYCSQYGLDWEDQCIHDDDCGWSYSDAECSHSSWTDSSPALCKYDYHFGDIKLSESCRVTDTGETTNALHVGRPGPQCYDPETQANLEMFFGKTMVRSGGKALYGDVCPNDPCNDLNMDSGIDDNSNKCKESYLSEQEESKRDKNRDILLSLPENLNKQPYIEVLVDDAHIKSKKQLLAFRDNINLYTITWNNNDKTIGFIASEIKKKYPDLIIKKDGKQYLHITREKVAEQPELKQLFAYGGSGNWLSIYLTSHKTRN